MRGFRETFSRPVRRIRFLGLFDTVSSVPQMENAWMQRTKFPYSARTSAKTIRHAVSIDERRAKFRQDLIGGKTKLREDQMANKHMHRYNSDLNDLDESGHPLDANGNPLQRPDELPPQINEASKAGKQNDQSGSHFLGLPSNLLGQKTDTAQQRDLKPGPAFAPGKLRRRQYSGINKKQDIEEVWFAGGHSDIGGGWHRNAKETWMLSHTPLVWMVHEAMNAGLVFDAAKVKRANCHPNAVDEDGGKEASEESFNRFLEAFNDSHTTGLIHDALEWSGGSAFGTVLMWKVFEHLPFRRMDLQPDGSWKPIRWPLPMGETRDIPDHAQIHRSVVRRMQHDANYRPGNLIVGGGGRGVRKAPEQYGIGDWEKHKNHDDPIFETYVKAGQIREQMAE